MATGAGTNIPAARLFSSYAPKSAPFTTTRYFRPATALRNTTTGLPVQANGLVIVNLIRSLAMAHSVMAIPFTPTARPEPTSTTAS